MVSPTSTTDAALSNRFRRIQTDRPKHTASSHKATAQSRKPVVPHHFSLSTVSRLSKLAPNAHQPQTNKENGMKMAVIKSTGRTVRRRSRRKAGGRTRVGIRSTSSKGSIGTTEGALRLGDFGGYKSVAGQSTYTHISRSPDKQQANQNTEERCYPKCEERGI